MRSSIAKAANLACLCFVSVLVVLVGSKGLGVSYPEILQLISLQAMHLTFIAAFGLNLAAAVGAREKAASVLYALPLGLFAAALALAAVGVRFPAPLLIVFDLYLIVGCVFALAFPPLPVPRAGAYREVPAASSYELLNTGGMVLVCTKGADGRYDVAPIAWSCPLDYEPSSRVLIVLDPGHLTTENLERTGEFALALPTYAQKELVAQTGSVSGRDGCKFEKFGIGYEKTVSVDARVPSGTAGYLECRVFEIRRVGSVAVIAADVVRAAAVPDAWRYRLHYSGGDNYYRPSFKA